MDSFTDRDCVDICIAEIEVGGAESDRSILEARLEDQRTNFVAGEHCQIGNAVPQVQL
jgi:hypothetical protein